MRATAAAAAGAQRARGAGRHPPRGADLARGGGAPVGHLEADGVECAAGAARLRASCARPRRGPTGRATAPSSSSRCPTRRSCSASTSAPGTCAPPSPTSRAPSARARTSSCTVPTPPACWRWWTRCAARCSRHRGSASTWSTPPSSACPAWSARTTRSASPAASSASAARASPRRCATRLPFPVTFENDVNLAARRRAVGRRRAGRRRLRRALGRHRHRRRHRARRRAAPWPPRRGGRDRPRLRRARARHRSLRGGARGVRDAGSAATTPARPRCAPPYDTPAVFAAARAGDELAAQVVAEAARRIAANIVPIAAVADVSLVVLGGGIGANGDLLLTPVRETAPDLAAVPAPGRRLEPRRVGGADRRPRPGGAQRARQRLQPSPAALDPGAATRSRAHRKRRGNWSTIPIESMSAICSPCRWIAS